MFVLQLEESLTNDLRVAVVFSSQGMPLSKGKKALDAMETTYDLIFSTVDEKDKFVQEVGARMHLLHCAWDVWTLVFHVLRTYHPYDVTPFHAYASGMHML